MIVRRHFLGEAGPACSALSFIRFNLWGQYRGVQLIYARFIHAYRISYLDICHSDWRSFYQMYPASAVETGGWDTGAGICDDIPQLPGLGQGELIFSLAKDQQSYIWFSLGFQFPGFIRFHSVTGHCLSGRSGAWYVYLAASAGRMWRIMVPKIRIPATSLLPSVWSRYEEYILPHTNIFAVYRAVAASCMCDLVLPTLRI